MVDDDRFEYESLQDSESIQHFLKSLVEGFENGRIALATEDREIHLYPEALLKFKVKAKKKPGDSSQLQIKISWRESGGSKGAAGQTIRILS